jgi:hypothetical protein
MVRILDCIFAVSVAVGLALAVLGALALWVSLYSALFHIVFGV